MENIGAFFKTQRIYNGLSLREVAKELDISASYLCNIEKDRRYISKNSMLNKLCELYIIPDRIRLNIARNIIKNRCSVNKDSLEFCYIKYLEKEITIRKGG